MFVLSQGACRAIGVGTNLLFLFFLPALYLQGAHLHPSLLLLGQGRLQVCSTRVCSVPPPRALGMLCPCPASARVGLLWLLWPYSSWAFSHRNSQRGVGLQNQSWAGERLFLTIAAIKKAAENRRLLAGERWEQGGASCRVLGSLGWWQCWKTEPWWLWWWHTRGTRCWGKEQPERRLSLSWREEVGWKKQWEMGWKSARRARSLGQICRSCQCHQRRGWRSHPFQTRQSTLDALPEAGLQTHPERSRLRQREILFSYFKNKKSDKISRKRCWLGPAPAPGGGSTQHVSLLWGQRCRCCTVCGRAGARGMKGCSLPGAAGRVKAQWNTWALSDSPPTAAELQLGLTAVAMGYLVSFGHELPSDFGHDLPSGFGHELPSGFGHELSSEFVHDLPTEFVHDLPGGFGHGLPDGFGHELPGEFVHELPGRFGHELPTGFGEGLGQLLRPAKHLLLPWLVSFPVPVRQPSTLLQGRSWAPTSRQAGHREGVPSIYP